MEDEIQPAAQPAEPMATLKMCYWLIHTDSPQKFYFTHNGQFSEDRSLAIKFVSIASAERHGKYVGLPFALEEVEIP